MKEDEEKKETPEVWNGVATEDATCSALGLKWEEVNKTDKKLPYESS